MDLASLIEYTDGMERELFRIKGYPFIKVPTIVKLLEWEVTRLRELLLTMPPDDVYTGSDGLMLIESLSQDLEIRDVESLKVLRKWLIDESKFIKFFTFPPLHRIIDFIHIVVRLLDQKISRESSAAVSDYLSRAVEASSSSDLEQGSSTSPQKYAGKSLEWYISFAVNTNMLVNPRDFCKDQVIELLQRLSDTFPINVDDEDIRSLILQKCNEAIESRDKRLADQGGSGSNNE